MKKAARALCLAALAASAASAAPESRLVLTADRIAADRNTESLVASGNVTAVSHPTRLLSDWCEKNADNVSHFAPGTMVTTCTNDLCALHWSLSGEVEYAEGRYVMMRDMLVRFWGLPVFWAPYWKYPLDGESCWRFMPGYTGRWGAYLLNKFVYHLAGDEEHRDGSWYLHGNTRFDLRYENGVALGETLYWQLGDFGKGKFKVYYAWDADASRYTDDWSSDRDWNYRNWGSEVPQNRYGVELSHRWEVTERDTLRLDGHLFSDSHFRSDFFRDSLFGIKNRWSGFPGNEIAWEHVENRWGAGLSVSGPINDFVSGTSRLPEFYLDVSPTPVWSLPVNYETENRAGFLHRQAAHYGDGETDSAYAYNPGRWAHYQALRIDTYHRLTAPFKVADAVSVVPRLGFRGTFWGDSGLADYTGWGSAGKTGDQVFRSILEGGVTFAGRGVAWLDDGWQHLLEPYADVLAQEAWHSGLGKDGRPYVFDSIDASRDWEDQFAGRSRNLPYSYYGVTPGVRNAIRKADEKGALRTVLDFDAYAALQFNRADLKGEEWHSLADPGSPNCGEDGLTVVPGARVRWFPAPDCALSGRAEYDAENNALALANVRWSQQPFRRFGYHVSFVERDYRWWDYASSPFDPAVMQEDAFNRVRHGYVEVGFEHELCDAVAWSPFVRWDCRENELDEVGGWIDLRTDCLGFRFILGYSNSYERLDGAECEEDWNIGFYVYLRAFGADGAGSVFGD